MIGFISFLFSIISYSLLLIFLFFTFFKEKNNDNKKEVLIHTAIVPSIKPKPTIKRNIKNTRSHKIIDKHTHLNKIKKGAKSNFTKGGKVDFKDIFKNVNENVNTTPLKLEKSLNMSKNKGLSKIEKNLYKVQSLNVDIFYRRSSSDNKELDKAIKEITKIWYDISNLAGEYAKLNIVSKNNKIYVIILKSNLDQSKQIELINRIKSLSFNKDFSFDILFQTKVNK